MSFLTHDAILAADDRPTERVSVPEWGGDVMVRGMDGQGRDEYFAAMAVQRGKQMVQDVNNVTARLVARCIVDPESLQPMFTAEEADILGRKSAAALDRVGNVASRLSGLTEDDMEELKKDSKSTQNGGCTSGSPVTLAPPSRKPSARSRPSNSPSGPSTTG